MVIRRKDFTHLTYGRPFTRSQRIKEKFDMERIKKLETLVRVGKEILNSIDRKKIESTLSGDELNELRNTLFYMGAKVRDNMGELFNLTGNPAYLIWEETPCFE